MLDIKEENNNRTPSERMRIARAGGIASGKKRKKVKEMKDILFTLIAKPLHKGDVANLKEVESIAEVKGLNVDLYTAMALAQINKALNGDLKALEWVQNNIGQNPTLLLEEERARLEAERQHQMVQELIEQDKERAQDEKGALGALFEELRARKIEGVEDAEDTTKE